MFYWKNNLKLCFCLADTPIRAEVTTSFEKLADEPSQFKGKILMLLEKPLKSKTVQLVKFKVKDYATCEFTWNDL